LKQPSRPHGARQDGFTLVELLVVIGMMVLLSSLAIPALESLKKADSLNSATASVATLLDEARAYAMAHNTYVFIGFEETNFSTPTTQAQTVGTGRVAVQAFSSIDGTLNLGASTSNGTPPSNLTAIIRAQIFDNLDLPASISSSSSGLTNRPSGDYIVGSSSFPAFPSGSGITSGKFSFSKVIAFDPQGQLHLPATSPPQTGMQYLEIDMQQSNGAAVPNAAHDLSAIQIDGLTGAVTIYRS
jgi:prepilin-type N-terminal cleavage/methylation domain-containing protein